MIIFRMQSEINVLAENEASNLTKNKEWRREQQLCYVINLETSLTLEAVKLIQTATVSSGVGKLTYVQKLRCSDLYTTEQFRFCLLKTPTCFAFK